MEFIPRGTGSWVAAMGGRSFVINRLNRDLWELVIQDKSGTATIARVTSDTKSSLRKWAAVYDANPYAERWPGLTRIARTQVLMIELDPNLEVRDTGWISGQTEKD